jgi:hypothetical protein
MMELDTTFNNQADDIECVDWLNEVDLPQYEETFRLNCSLGDNLLSRKRLAQIRIKDFPYMNITNHEHQKLLHEHIQHTLNFSFHSPLRRREVKIKMGKPLDEGPGSADDKPDGGHRTKSSTMNSSVSGRRRRSFDASAWNSINKLRTADRSHKVAAEVLRGIRVGDLETLQAPTEKKVRRRRRSFEGQPKPQTDFEKGQAYGNMAHLFDMIRAEMMELQAEVITYFRDLMKCEEAQILFVDERTQQMMLQHNSIWYRMSIDSGIAGECYRTGQAVIVENCYESELFNRRLDEKLGIRSYNKLCQPVRGNRGAGNIVAIVVMINKHIDPLPADRKHAVYTEFDSQDEETLALCVQRVAEDLGDRFAELLLVGDQFCGSAVLVPSQQRYIQSNRNLGDTAGSSEGKTAE